MGEPAPVAGQQAREPGSQDGRPRLFVQAHDRSVILRSRQAPPAAPSTDKYTLSRSACLADGSNVRSQATQYVALGSHLGRLRTGQAVFGDSAHRRAARAPRRRSTTTGEPDSLCWTARRMQTIRKPDVWNQRDSYCHSPRHVRSVVTACGHRRAALVTKTIVAGRPSHIDSEVLGG
jgi:hypothetical protein